MKKVLITGPTGAIGMALISSLLNENIEVTALCHKGSKRIENLPKTDLLNIVECDLHDLLSCKDLPDKGYDVFYHFGWAGTTGAQRNDVSSQIDNIRYTIDAVELAYYLGCKRFIGAGSQAEYGRCEEDLNAKVPVFPETGYGIAKLAAGNLSRLRCEQLGLEHIWTRILSVYGPYEGENSLVSSMIHTLLLGEKPSTTKGEQIWDYIYAKDIARAFVLLGEKGINGKVYCIGSGEGRPLREYMETIRNTIDPSLAVGFGEVPYAEKQVMRLCADITELKQDTGFVPVYTFEQGIRETVDYWKQERKKR